MSRIRTIKPDFWEDEKVGQLTIPCRLFFIGCWNFADDFGVIKGNAALLKSQIFPYDENLRVSEIKKWIDALVNARMLIPIIHAEESYYIIRTFRSHQVLDNRYSKSYISKDKSLVSKIVNDAINNNIVNTSSTQCVHNVITTEEMEKEEKEDTSNETSKKVAKKPVEINYDEVMKSYNEMLSPPFPRCTKMMDARKSAIKARVADYGIASVITVFQKVKDSQFLHGKKWCGFDWIFKPANYIKILEGNYDNGEQIQRNSASGFTSKQEANEYALNQFIKYREARASGIFDEVEKPF